MSLLSRRPRPAPEGAGTGYSLLDGQLSVVGDLETGGSLRIDGSIEGRVRRADTVVLGVFAKMVGDIHAREVIIGGSLTGNIFAAERVELQATAIVNGDVSTPVVLVQEGGVVNGRVVMLAPSATDPKGDIADGAAGTAAPAASSHVVPSRR